MNNLLIEVAESNELREKAANVHERLHAVLDTRTRHSTMRLVPTVAMQPFRHDISRTLRRGFRGFVESSILSLVVSFRKLSLLRRQQDLQLRFQAILEYPLNRCE